MVKVFKGIDLTIVSPKNESEINLAKVSGRLEQIDSNEFMFTDVPKKIYAPKDRFYDGDYVSCVIGEDGKTARVYFKKIEINARKKNDSCLSPTIKRMENTHIGCLLITWQCLYCRTYHNL